MKVKVDSDLCISCGFCVGNCPEVFEFNDDGISHVKVDTVPKECEDSVREVIDGGCPTDAVKEEE